MCISVLTFLGFLFATLFGHLRDFLRDHGIHKKVGTLEREEQMVRKIWPIWTIPSYFSKSIAEWKGQKTETSGQVKALGLLLLLWMAWTKWTLKYVNMAYFLTVVVAIIRFFLSQVLKTNSTVLFRIHTHQPKPVCQCLGRQQL